MAEQKVSKSPPWWMQITGCLLLSGIWGMATGPASAAEPPPAMVLIPAGTFVMGSNAAGDEPAHTVHLRTYLIDRLEVTQDRFRKVMEKNPSDFKEPVRPVEQVTWYEARDFCRKLGKRLPTEAEWEKAARGGADNLYYWGDEPDGAHAWYWENSDRQTHPAGEKKPNPLGLRDISGNVWEWTADYYGDDYYPQSPKENPQGPFSGKYRVIRGGSWRDPGNFLRVSRRNYELPGGRFNHIGFRCAKDG